MDTKILDPLRGADVKSTSRKYRMTVATLNEWRDRFLAGGEASVKSREVQVGDEEKRRLKSGVPTLHLGVIGPLNRRDICDDVR